MYFISISCCIAMDMDTDSKDPKKELKIAVALRNNPEELSDFLNILAKKMSPNEGEEKVLEDAATRTMDATTLFSYALKPLLVHNQETLSIHDILGKEGTSHQYLNVFKIDLPELDFLSANGQAAIEFFKKTPLPNLRSIGLVSAKNVPIFINSIFSEPSLKNKFYSTMVINAEKSDITSENLEILFYHFRDYAGFIRDMKQISSRFQVPAVSLNIGIDSYGALKRGIQHFTASTTKVYYRTGESDDAMFMVVTQ